MFVGRYVLGHKISISVIVEHVKHIGTIRGFFLPGGDLKTVNKFINKMLINLCNRIFTQ